MLTFIVGILLIFLINYTTADESFTFAKDNNFTLQISMANADLSSCYTCSCNYSIFSSNGSAMIENYPATSSNGFCILNYSLSNSGIYPSEISFTDGTSYGKSSFEISINPNGTAITQSKAILYIVFMILAIVVLIASIYFSIRIPWRNSRDEEGTVISVNYLKYLKLFLIVMSYIFLMFLFGLSQSIFNNYLFETGVGGFFEVMYWIMLSFLWPGIVLSFIFMVIVFLEDRKIKEAIERGFPLE